MKRKGKIGMIFIVIVVLIAAIAGGAIFATSGERREGRNLPIADVDFSKLKDGSYIGNYEGGKYKWRKNKVEIKVSSGELIDINLIESSEGKPSEYAEKLYERVIQKQSLQVDTISGATITSKAYLKSVENALLKAKKD